jgi:hypothetical protein
MLPSLEQLLVVREIGRSWAVPSGAVLAVERQSGWSGAAPLDLQQLLGESPLGSVAVDTPHEARVLVVGNARSRVPLLARGALGLLQVSAEALLPLPAPLRARAPLVDHVALENGAPSIFVLSPERLLEVSRG